MKQDYYTTILLVWAFHSSHSHSPQANNTDSTTILLVGGLDYYVFGQELYWNSFPCLPPENRIDFFLSYETPIATRPMATRYSTHKLQARLCKLTIPLLLLR